MLAETIEGLNIKPQGVYVDVTFGGGGHSRAIMKDLQDGGKLFSFDQDKDAASNAIDDPKWVFVHANFRYLKNWMDYYGVEQMRQVLDEWDPEDQLIMMQFMADAEYLEMDGQGRVLLQKKNLETIGAQQDVLFVGMLNRFALWTPENFENKRLSQTELAARLRAKMSNHKS